MEPLLILAGVATAAGGLFYFRRQRSAPAPILKLDPREDRLARQLAKSVGYPIQDVLPSIRVELELASHLDDEIIFKRAKYHFQQNLPEAQCSVYRDRKVG